MLCCGPKGHWTTVCDRQRPIISILRLGRTKIQPRARESNPAHLNRPQSMTSPNHCSMAKGKSTARMKEYERPPSICHHGSSRFFHPPRSGGSSASLHIYVTEVAGLFLEECFVLSLTWEHILAYLLTGKAIDPIPAHAHRIRHARGL